MATSLLLQSIPDQGDLFELMPVALWEEDFTALKAIFDEWRARGVTDLHSFLQEDLDRVSLCAHSIQIKRVNQRALSMLGANSLEQLSDSLSRVIRGEALLPYMQELLQIWEGNTNFSSTTVNYRLDGSRIDVRVNGTIHPDGHGGWSRVIVAFEDISEQEAARRALLISEAEARALFNDSPVSIWLENFNLIKVRLDELRNRGIVDFRTFIDVHPDFVELCMRDIHVLDVNQHTLSLFGARNKGELLNRLDEVFRDEMRDFFAEQLIALWDGKLFHEREVMNYRLDGEPLNLILQFSVMPGRETDWAKVLVSLTDITARKKAEAYLEYLGKHDVLTGLHNRSYYTDEINRLNRKGPFPVAIILIDLNGLKPVNDELGHAEGDAMLRRAGEILKQVVDRPGCAARIGGDEFVILLPANSEQDMQGVLENLAKVAELNNQFHSSKPPVLFSVGAATCDAGGKIEAAILRADIAMYENKRDFYASSPTMNRRQT
ncbi:sensor domain-containing diguanylate cyclase [Acidocella aminolytica]|uniref:Diguanylate cyclase n=1 Tax=Acidocella aminolytica 101 = DSM 11237 TaxID=1120923 RepID=A0A0D6PJU7_9PROT|nr:diguanylate cyclase [Acidocella aminolytica]GAN81059.1 diguanylate cyclase [Acidocella aminolytica 101 = DSM 11237]GBQ42797.1 diguanylate cyclase [Acidocella aminolytica 101 = DSM 11237]SHF18440.1 PAS domain S-box-containing protein/diguanylate cyclase (GGDEF) domain-containing protein [Acidocella aminolytica 101 = DSM 11237]